MLKKIEALDRTALALMAIGLAVILFLALNVATNLSLGSARVDLTEDSLFTLSRGTRDVLAAIDEPITIRLYQSKDADKLGPFIVNQSKRVNELLKQYERLSRGRIRVERYDPQPFSPEEDQAVSDGLRGLPLAPDNIPVYFGLAGTNSTDDLDTIAFLAPERANFLEYDLTRLVYNLAHPEKPIVAVIGDLPMRGTQANNFRPTVALEQMQQLFDVRFMGGELQRIPDDAKILLLVHPQIKDPNILYAVDQYVMRGGHVLAFIDPLAEIMDANAIPGRAPKQTAITDMEPLLASWGVSMVQDRVVGDRQLARSVQATDRGRAITLPYVAWISVGPENLNPDDVVTGGIQRLNLRSVGGISARPGATTHIEPLIRSSRETADVVAAKVQTMPNVLEILNEFQPSGQTRVFAARVTGPVKSAFREGAPATITKEDVRAEHLAEAKAPLNLILVGDADMLSDSVWAQVQGFGNQRYAVPIANNGDFLIGALDNLAGSEGIIGLRGRGLSVRPFVVLQEMEDAAQLRYRAKEQELQKKIDETQERIEALQVRQQTGGVLLTTEQLKQIDTARGDMLDLRQDLRGVQRALREDVEGLEAWLRALNIWAVPLMIGVLALVLAGFRRARAARFQASLVH